MSNPFPPAVEVAREAFEAHEQRFPVRLRQIRNSINECISQAKEAGMPGTKFDWPEDCDTTLYYDSLRDELEKAGYQVRMEGSLQAQTLRLWWGHHRP